MLSEKGCTRGEGSFAFGWGAKVWLETVRMWRLARLIGLGARDRIGHKGRSKYAKKVHVMGSEMFWIFWGRGGVDGDEGIGYICTL